MKGVILAGGSGSRLLPITKVVSKQLLNVFDKPMIYYPLSTLMLSGIREICLVTTPHDLPMYRELLEDGSQFGIQITYLVQEQPEGLPQALILAEEFLNGESCCLILGDNLFYGPTLGNDLRKYVNIEGCQIFAYQVADPSRYGVISILENGEIESLEEKPAYPRSNFAIPGLYYFDGTASRRAKNLVKSKRNEYEIIDLLRNYLQEKNLHVHVLPRGTAWLDTGTPESLHDASSYIKAIQERQGLLISSPEEIGLRNNWISKSDLLPRIKSFFGNRYFANLVEVIETIN